MHISNFSNLALNSIFLFTLMKSFSCNPSLSTSYLNYSNVSCGLIINSMSITPLIAKTLLSTFVGTQVITLFKPTLIDN